MGIERIIRERFRELLILNDDNLLLTMKRSSISNIILAMNRMGGYENNF